jgi:hypothetical protein
MMYYNFVRIHSKLRTSPAMAAGVTDKLSKVSDIVALWEAVEPTGGKRGPYKREDWLPLRPLPSDPRPTEEDLAAINRSLLLEGRNSKRLTRQYLAFEWRLEVVKSDPNAFHVPFCPADIDYSAYLSSATWQRIRQAVLTSTNWRCAGCGPLQRRFTTGITGRLFY